MKMKKIISAVALLTLGATTVSYASIDKNLKYGQRDKEVTELQEFLIDKGLLKTTPSTYFGLLTLKAVKAYQASINVSPTGFVGVLTREKINKEIDIEVASSNEAEKAEASTIPTTTKTNTQPVSFNTNTSTGDDSIYDSNTKIDTLGRKIIITQDPNYKFLNIVRAKVEISGKTLTGFFYKNTKTFMTEDDISLQQSITAEQMKNKQVTTNMVQPAQTQPVNTQTRSQTMVQDNSGGLQTYSPVTFDKRDIVISTPTAKLSITTNDFISFEFVVKNESGNAGNSYVVNVTNPEGETVKPQIGGDGSGQIIYRYYYNKKPNVGNSTFIIDVPELGIKKNVIFSVSQFVAIPPVVTFNVNKVEPFKAGNLAINRIPIGYLKIDPKNQRLTLLSIKYSLISSDYSLSEIPLRMCNLTWSGISDIDCKMETAIEFVPIVFGAADGREKPITKQGKFKVKIEHVELYSNFSTFEQKSIPVDVSSFITEEITITP